MWNVVGGRTVVASPASDLWRWRLHILRPYPRVFKAALFNLANHS
jgi:hypothetical protein